MDKKREELEAELDVKLKEFMPFVFPRVVDRLSGRASNFMINARRYYKDKRYSPGVTKSMLEVVGKLQDMLSEIQLIEEEILACKQAEHDEADRKQAESYRLKTLAAREAKRKKAMAAKRDIILRGGNAGPEFKEAVRKDRAGWEMEKFMAKEKAKQRKLERARQIRMEVERRYAKK